MVVCFPGAKIEVITERAEKILVPGKGGFILVHVGINDAEREGTTCFVDIVCCVFAKWQAFLGS